VDRNSRQKAHFKIHAALSEEAKAYPGNIIKPPFGTLFPAPNSIDSYFDLQIEGVGSKTLLAEISGNYKTIGIDGVAMAVNDVIRSGADPVLISDGIHISKSNPDVVRSIISGVREGAKLAGCTLASGETGDVSELLHSQIEGGFTPFDLFVSCFGIASREDVIMGKISAGDRIIGLKSSGIHSNGLTLARKLLLKQWGGKYEIHDTPETLDRSIVEELMEPTKIYTKEIKTAREVGKIKAAVHITGDGLSKFRRLLSWQPGFENSNLGVKLKISSKLPIFNLILETEIEAGTPIAILEMFSTFNMGYGFAIIVSSKDSR
jgi:phosphoribosylformylglycinamidine cyclo-ligase